MVVVRKTSSTGGSLRIHTICTSSMANSRRGPATYHDDAVADAVGKSASGVDSADSVAPGRAARSHCSQTKTSSPRAAAARMKAIDVSPPGTRLVRGSMMKR